MQKHNQEVFLIESLQPSWLPTRSWQWTYTLVSRLIFGLTFALITDELIITGIIIGLSLGLIDGVRFEWIQKQEEKKKTPIFWWLGINIVVVGLIVGLTYGLIYGLGYDPINMLFGGTIIGSIFGLIFGLRGSQQNLEKDIQTVEVLRWSWSKALKGGLITGILGLTGGLLFMLMIAERPAKPLDLLPDILPLAVYYPGQLFGLVGVILNGLRHEIIETKSAPNQGIRLSIRNAIFGGLIVGLIFGLSAEILLSGWMGGPFFGLIAGLAGALWYGGLDVIQHYTLHLILLIQGHTPANYARFLDYAVDRIFLQKVGGGYRFIHRLLLEHFAEMGEAKKG